MALQPTDIQDVVNTTITKYGRLKATDLMSTYNKTIAVKKLFKKHKTEFQGGSSATFNVLTDTNNSFRMVPIGATDIVDIPNVTAQGSIPWRGASWNWAMDAALISMNSSSEEKIFDILQSQRIAAAGSAIIGLEKKWWRCPASTSTLDPFGLEYWLVKNATEGFNGTVGSGFTLVGGINPSILDRWRNWTAGYSNISQPDLVSKIRRAQWETDFEPLVDETPEYSTGDTPEMYCNYTTLRALQDLAVAQNDDLGSDLASMDAPGKVTIGGRQLSAVKELENDTTNPIWGVDWSQIFMMVLSGWMMRESHIPMKSDQHTISVTHVDMKFNFGDYNRRKSFVISNGTTAMA